jgi:hypothetical protein
MDVNTIKTPSVFGPEYPKIQSCFKRNMADGGVILPNQFSTEEFEYLRATPWTWTEKVDGTNVRLHYDGDSITAGGRTKDAQMPGHLIYALAQYNNPERWASVFTADGKPEEGQPDVTVYGEGYGPKIQNGGRYRSDVGFIVFDIRVGKWWLKREDVIEIAAKLGMDVVPVVMVATLHEAIYDFTAIVNESFKAWIEHPNPNFFHSRVAASEQFTMEGLVGTPSVPMYDRRGQRIITKLKIKDFEDLAKREARRAPMASKVPSSKGYEPNETIDHVRTRLGLEPIGAPEGLERIGASEE